MPSTPEVFIALRLHGSLDPQAVSEMLGLTPSEMHVEGEVAGDGHSGRRYQHSGWSLSSDGQVDADAFEPHAQWLLDRLEPNASALREVATSDGIGGAVDCYWASVGMSGGPWISSETMTRLGALGLPLVISFYATISDEG